MRARVPSVRRGLRLLAIRLTLRAAWDRAFEGLAVGGVLGAAAAAIARAGLPGPAWLPAALFAGGAALGALAGLARPIALAEAAAFADARVPGADGLFGAALEADGRPDWGAFGPRISEAAERAWTGRGETLRLAFRPPPAALAAAVLAAMCASLAFLPSTGADPNGRTAAAAKALRRAAAGDLPEGLREALERGVASLEAGTLSEEERQRLLDLAVGSDLPDAVKSRLAWALAQAGGGGPDAAAPAPGAEGAPGGTDAGAPSPAPPDAPRIGGSSQDPMLSIPPHLREFVADYYRIRNGFSRNRKEQAR